MRTHTGCGHGVSSLQSDLPPAFARIPADGPKGLSARPHVAGTLQAEDAVIEASIPQTQEHPAGMRPWI